MQMRGGFQDASGQAIGHAAIPMRPMPLTGFRNTSLGILDFEVALHKIWWYMRYLAA